MLNRLLNLIGYEKRASSAADDSWGRVYRPGAFVSHSSVLSNLAVATACVRLRAELMAKVSCKVFEVNAVGDRTRATDLPLARVLNDLANPLMTSFELREFIVRSLDLFGNAFTRVERDGAGQVVALWPLEASRVQVERLEGGNRLRYRYSGNNGPVMLLQDEVLHVRNSSEDGLLGRSPIAIARGSLALAVSQNETAETISTSGMRIAGVMTHPGKLSPPAKENIRESIESKHAGPKNAGRVLIAEEGMRFSPTQFSPLDSELLESRKLSNEDVCRVFGCPPASVGISTSVSYGSALQAQQDLVSNTLAPLAARLEQAFMRCLLSEAGRRRYVIEFDLASLLRGDEHQIWQVHKIQRELGAASTNEIRRVHNQPPIPGGDDYSPLRASPAPAQPPIASIEP